MYWRFYMLSQFINMNPKVFNTHQEIWALMFQGVKYTVKSVQERFSVWTHTHRGAEGQISWFLTDLCERQLCGKRKWSYFYNQRFYFCPRGGFCAPDGTQRRWHVAERASTILFPVTFSELLTVRSPFSASVFTGPRSAEGSGSNVWV